MTLLNLTRAWPALQEQTTTHVIMPNNIQSDHPLQVLWMFHGLGDSGNGWIRKTNLGVLTKYTNLAVITPEMGRSFYMNMANGLPYWNYLTKEVIPEMRKLLPISTDPKDNFVSGVSMGGFGALKLVFTHPNWFSATIAISSVVDLSILPELMPDYRGIFNDPIPKHFLEDLASQAPQESLKKIRFYDCIGDQDFLKSDNDSFATYMKTRLDLNVTYKTSPGDHDWLYWQSVLPDILTWLLKVRLDNGQPLSN